MFSFIRTKKTTVFAVQDPRSRFMNLRLFKFTGAVGKAIKKRYLIIGGVSGLAGLTALWFGAPLWISAYLIGGSVISLILAGIIYMMTNDKIKGIPLAGIIAFVGMTGFFTNLFVSTGLGVIFIVPYLLGIVAALTGTNVFDTYVEKNKETGRRQLVGWRHSEMFGQR